jgi:hypothetical protein
VTELGRDLRGGQIVGTGLGYTGEPPVGSGGHVHWLTSSIWRPCWRCSPDLRLGRSVAGAEHHGAPADAGHEYRDGYGSEAST